MRTQPTGFIVSRRQPGIGNDTVITKRPLPTKQQAQAKADDLNRFAAKKGFIYDPFYVQEVGPDAPNELIDVPGRGLFVRPNTDYKRRAAVEKEGGGGAQFYVIDRYMRDHPNSRRAPPSVVEKAQQNQSYHPKKKQEYYDKQKAEEAKKKEEEEAKKKKDEPKKEPGFFHRLFHHDKKARITPPAYLVVSEPTTGNVIFRTKTAIGTIGEIKRQAEKLHEQFPGKAVHALGTERGFGAEKLAVNLPADVERYVKETEKSNPDYDEAKVWAVAWSRYCKYKNPGSEHCQKSPGEYFPGRAASEDQMNKTAGDRPLWQIAKDIKKNWQRPYFGAVPYLEAMEQLDSINDMFYEDSAKSVVLYFLSNATTWRGDVAKAIKAELKSMAAKATRHFGALEELEKLASYAADIDDPGELDRMLADFNPGGTEFGKDDKHPELDEGSLIPGIEERLATESQGGGKEAMDAFEKHLADLEEMAREASGEKVAFSQEDSEFCEWAAQQQPMSKMETIAALKAAGVDEILPPRTKRQGPRFQEGDDVLIDVSKHKNDATLAPYKEYDGKVGKVVGIDATGIMAQFKTGQPVNFPDAQKASGVGIKKWTPAFDMEGSKKLEIIYEAGGPTNADRMVVVEMYLGRGRGKVERRVPYYTGHAFSVRYNAQSGIYFSLFPQQRMHVDPNGASTEAGYEATSMNPDVGKLHYLGVFGKRPTNWKKELEAIHAAADAGTAIPMQAITAGEAADEADDITDDFLARFEEGKPADPTDQMSPEDAKKWKDMNEEHKDKFKEASTLVEAWGTRPFVGKGGDNAAQKTACKCGHGVDTDGDGDCPHCAGKKTAATSPTGLYGYTRKIQSDCETCARKVAKTASTIAKRIYAKDGETAPFLATHVKRGTSLPAEILVAAMKDLGPKVDLEEKTEAPKEVSARLNELREKTAKTHGLYGFKAKTASLGLSACSELREQTGIIASDLHRRRADAHESITGFMMKHAEEGGCIYSRLLHASYPDASLKTASVPGTTMGWLEWEE